MNTKKSMMTMMIPINNSDTAWLIVSDYNQENGLPYDELKEDVLNPTISDWFGEVITFGIGCNNRGYPHLVNPVGCIPTGHWEVGGGVVGSTINGSVGTCGQVLMAGVVIGGRFVGERWWTDRIKH